MARLDIARFLRSSTAMVPVLLVLSAPSASAASLVVGASGPETRSIVDAQSYDDMKVGLAGNSSLLSVTGLDAVLTIIHGSEVGKDGPGALFVTDGATFSTYEGSLYLANQGRLMVEGGNSRFEIGTRTTGVPADYTASAGWLYTYGGDVNVSDGATLSTDGLYVGGYSPNHATMTVTGKGTTLDAQLVIMVGGDGQGSNTDGDGLLTIADGATARASVIAAGIDPGSTGTILVTGAGSSLSSFYNNSTFVGKIYAGSNGNGKIIVQDGGTLSSPYEIRVAWGVGSTGKLIIGGDGAAAAPGAVSATRGIVFGDGSGQLIFNHTSTDYVFGSSIDGPGKVVVQAGTTTLSGTGSYTGGTEITGGALAVSGALSGSTDEVTLSGGRLANGGSISGSQYGVLFHTAGNVFTNSGSVSGGAASVFFGSGGNTLNILPGATFGNVVDYNNKVGNTTGFGAGSYRIPAANYRDADNRIALNNASQTVILDNASSTGTINVVAVTGASQAATQYTSAVSDVVGSILALDVARPDQVNVGGGTISALQYGEERPETKEARALRDLGNGVAVDGYGNLFWARAFGGLRYQPSRDGDPYSHTSHYGVISGVDHQFENYRLGFFGGGGSVRSVAGDSLSTLDGDTGFFGLYGAMKAAGLQWNASLTGGGINNRASRLINNGAETASGDFMGWYVSPELSVSSAYHIAPEWELTPSFKARYTGAFYNAYDESGSSQNISYDARETHSLDGRLQVELKRKLTLPSGLPAAVIGTAAVSDTQYLGSGTTHASLLNNEFSVSSSADKNVVGASIGVGFDAMVSQRASVYGGIDGTLYSDESKAMSGRVGMRLAF